MEKLYIVQIVVIHFYVEGDFKLLQFRVVQQSESVFVCECVCMCVCVCVCVCVCLCV